MIGPGSFSLSELRISLSVPDLLSPFLDGVIERFLSVIVLVTILGNHGNSKEDTRTKLRVVQSSSLSNFRPTKVDWGVTHSQRECVICHEMKL